jgi:hypothetical protein
MIIHPHLHFPVQYNKIHKRLQKLTIKKADNNRCRPEKHLFNLWRPVPHCPIHQRHHVHCQEAIEIIGADLNQNPAGICIEIKIH